MMTASIAFLVVGVGFFITAIALFVSRKNTNDPIYIDTSGIRKNDPKNFIDIWRGKTLNIKIDDKYHIIISDMPFLYAINHLERMAAIYDSLRQTLKIEVSQTAKNQVLLKVYNIAINHLYKMCLPYCKHKFGLKKALHNKASNNMMWLLSVCEEITDYWRVTEKKLELLGTGETLRGTAGQMFSWDSLKVDDQGKILIPG